MDLKKLVAEVVDYPKKDINFKDITPLMADGEAFAYCCNKIREFAISVGAEIVVGPEARGFIFGCPVANTLQIGFVPIRKKGKLPRPTVDFEYQLEYGTNTLSIHKDAIKLGQRVLIVDDLLATGGTMAAATSLVEKLGGVVAGIACLIEIKDLNGRELLQNYPLFSLITY